MSKPNRGINDINIDIGAMIANHHRRKIEIGIGFECKSGGGVSQKSLKPRSRWSDDLLHSSEMEEHSFFFRCLVALAGSKLK